MSVVFSDRFDVARTASETSTRDASTMTDVSGGPGHVRQPHSGLTRRHWSRRWDQFGVC